MAAKTSKTKYVVLRAAETAGFWEALPGEYEGHSAEEAIRTAKDAKGPETGGRFVAVPTGSWRPAKVITETTPKTTVTFEKAPRARAVKREPEAAAT